jgi:hypothetical protein
MHQHAFDAILQCDRTRVASSARTAQLQRHNAILEPAKLNVATVLLNSRPDTGLQELLDHADNFTVVLVVRQTVLLGSGISFFTLDHVDDSLAAGDGLCDESKDLRPNMRPIHIRRFCDCDEIAAVEDAGYSINVHELRGQWRGMRRRDCRARIHVLDEWRRHAAIVWDDLVVGEELEGIRVRCRLSLDKYSSHA